MHQNLIFNFWKTLNRFSVKISFSLQAFENVTDLNVFTISLTVSIIGFVIFNLFYAIFKFVAKLCGKELDQKGNFVFVDVVFVLLIVFFSILVA